MPKQLTEKEKKVRQKFVESLAVGVPGVETRGHKNPYSAQNGEGSAVGKYQFTEFWLDSKTFSIQDFAKDNGFGEIESMDDFKNNPSLQDSYFKYYAEGVLYPNAVKAFKGKNPAGLQLNEIGAMFHFKPQVSDKYGNTGVYEQVKTGNFDKPTKKGKDGAKFSNVGTLEYLKVFNETNEAAGTENISSNDLIDSGIETKLSKKQVIQNFLDERAKIDNSKHTDQATKEVQRKRLYDSISASGNKEIVNEYMTNENAMNQDDYNRNISKYNKLKDLIQESQFLYSFDENSKEEKAKTGKHFKINTPDSTGYTKVLGPENEAKNKEIEELFKDDGFISKAKKGGLNIDSKKIFKKFNDLHLELTGEEFNLKGENISESVMPYLLQTNPFKNQRYGEVSLDGASKIKDYQPNYLIKENSGPKRSEVIEESIKNNNIPSKKGNSKTETKTKTETGSTSAEVKSENPNLGLTSQYLKNRINIKGSATGDELEYQNSKAEIPIDAIVGLGLGIIGNDKAKKAKIPLRTEDISEAMRNYTADLKEKSKEGMPVEVEAQMKNMLAEAYQGGLANIVNASSGNSATVLGNQGQLEQAKTKGLIGIQVADYEAKDRAFAQYGKAIEYANDFNTRREMANHEILYGEGKQEQREGKAVATAGMAKMIDGFKYAKKTAPGSAYDMQRSYLMQKMFGYDPKATDNGLGDTEGTKSYYEANKLKAKNELLVAENLYKTFQSLNPKQQEAVDNVIGTTQDPDILAKVMQHVQTDGVDPKTVNPDRLNQAIKNNDMGLLTRKSPTKQEGITPSLPQPLIPMDVNNSGDIIATPTPIGLTAENGQMTDDPEAVKRLWGNETPQLDWADNDVELPTTPKAEHGLLNMNNYTQQ